MEIINCDLNITRGHSEPPRIYSSNAPFRKNTLKKGEADNLQPTPPHTHTHKHTLNLSLRAQCSGISSWSSSVLDVWSMIQIYQKRITLPPPPPYFRRFFCIVKMSHIFIFMILEFLCVLLCVWFSMFSKLINKFIYIYYHYIKKNQHKWQTTI